MARREAMAYHLCLPKMWQHRSKYLSPALVVLLSGVFTVYQFRNYEPVAAVELSSALSEALIALLALAGLLLVQVLQDVKRMYRALLVGFTALFVSLLTDVLDEFLEQPDLVTTIFEDLLQITGYALIIVGIWFWILHNNEMTAKLKRLATTDHLTSASNRRQFEEAIGRDIQRAARYAKEVLSVIIFDIDRFKKINDTFGHPVGDEVLRTIARIVRDNIRVTDMFARIGGEEFTVSTPRTELAGAQFVAEKLREAIQAHTFETVGAVTIGVGVAELKQDEDIEAFVGRADGAMYEAKESGRNRVIVAN